MTNNVVDDYGWDNADAPNSCGYIGKSIIEFIKSENPKRVADLGSGNGQLCKLIKESINAHVVGIEYDRKGVEISKKSYPDIPFYNFSVQDKVDDLMALEKECFDIVVSTEVIEHLFSPQYLPIYAHNILNKNGKLIITTPYHGYLKNLVLSILNKWDGHHTALWEGGHIKFWSKKTLSTLLYENGFEVDKFYGVGRFPFLWKSMVLVCTKVSDN